MAARLASNSPELHGSVTNSFSFDAFEAKMLGEQIDAISTATFRRAWEHLVAGETGLIPGRIAQPVDSIPEYAALPASLEALGSGALNRLVVCKLNGGLGTGMGLDGPKSLLVAKDGFTFLDISVMQILHHRRVTGARLPLLLMNSFTTRNPSLQALARWPELAQDLPYDFLQGKVPKVAKEDFQPARWPEDPDKEWCPPGHGEIYTALVATGLLDQMMAAGYEYLFVSNADNLGAVVDARILGLMESTGAPFLMEVAHRTAADRKGGHLAQRPDGQLILRESAQCPPDEQAQFQDIRRYGHFNTNNLWIHLPALRATLAENANVIDLPLIRNEKPVDPTQPDSPRVYQLETAMGSAISSFAGAMALEVPRSRFTPVKKNSDLLVLWSDAYVLTDDARIELAPSREEAPVVRLDDRYYSLIDEMTLRLPHGAPSLLHCKALTVEGDVRFGRAVKVVGDVTLRAEPDAVLHIVDEAVLGDAMICTQ